jgi:RND family efflux transporter MFP subunit
MEVHFVTSIRDNIAPGLLLIASLVLFSGCGSADPVPAEENSITVGVKQAEIMDISRRVIFSGTLRGIREVNVMPELSTRIVQVSVRPGDYVRAGQVVVLLDSSGLQASYQQAQASYDQVLANKRNNDIQLEAAQKHYERTKTLYDSGVASEVELEAAQRNLDMLNTGAIEAALATAEAGLKQIQDQLDKCTITAPIGGLVGAVNATVGQYSNPGAPLTVISDSSRLKTEILVSGSEINYLHVGDAVELKVAAVGSQLYPGTVTSVAPVANAQTQSFTVEVTMDNADQSVKSGMFAEVNADTIGRTGVIGLPTDAVLINGGKNVVYVLTEDMRAHEIPIEVGIYNHDFIEILSGIEPGQTVIVSGNTLISEGVKVKTIQEDTPDLEEAADE